MLNTVSGMLDGTEIDRSQTRLLDRWTCMHDMVSEAANQRRRAVSKLAGTNRKTAGQRGSEPQELHRYQRNTTMIQAGHTARQPGSRSVAVHPRRCFMRRRRGRAVMVPSTRPPGEHGPAFLCGFRLKNYDLLRLFEKFDQTQRPRCAPREKRTFYLASDMWRRAQKRLNQV